MASTLFILCVSASLWRFKSNQPGFGHPTAEGAEYAAAKAILNNLCDPLRPLRLVRLYQF